MACTRVQKNGITYALFFSSSERAVGGATFFTESSDEFQVGLFDRPSGYAVKPHMHPERSAVIQGTSEFLYVQEGQVEVTVFDEEWKELQKNTLTTGDFLLFFRGGHALTMLKPTRLIEVKQGPFAGDSSSKVFR